MAAFSGRPSGSRVIVSYLKHLSGGQGFDRPHPFDKARLQGFRFEFGEHPSEGSVAGNLLGQLKKGFELLLLFLAK